MVSCPSVFTDANIFIIKVVYTYIYHMMSLFSSGYRRVIKSDHACINPLAVICNVIDDVRNNNVSFH